jgi:hypothetical protein
MVEETGHKAHDDADKVMSVIKREIDDDGRLLLFEIQLEQKGMLSKLEEIGLISQVSNPNPFDPNAEAIEHDNWWMQHPEDEASFGNSLEERRKALRQIYTGALVSCLSLCVIRRHHFTFEGVF